MCLLVLFLCSVLSFRCPFLHRTAGDTERRYHLRYYKTGSCIHETDSKGNCSKNGSHCAFAHGSHDLRSPVYDIRCSMRTSYSCPYVTWCVCVCVLRRCCSLLLYVGFGREVQVMETQGGAGSTEGGGGDGQSGQAASTALIEKILSEEPRWQGNVEVSSTIPQQVVVTLLLFMYEMHPGVSLSGAAVIFIIFLCKIHIVPQCPQSLYLLAWQ